METLSSEEPEKRTQGFPFLKLSAGRSLSNVGVKFGPLAKRVSELRNNIYVLFIRNTFVQAWPKNLGRANLRSGRPLLVHSGLVNCLPENAQALFVVNRQVNAEARKILFDEITPCIYICDYLRRPPGSSIPGIFYDEVTSEPLDVTELDLLVADRGTCLTRLDMSFLTKFRNIKYLVKLGPQFPSKVAYLALRKVLELLADTLVKEKAVLPHSSSMELHWSCLELNSDKRKPLYQRLVKHGNIKTVVEILEWTFSDIPNLTFSTHIDFEVTGAVLFGSDRCDRGSYLLEDTSTKVSGYLATGSLDWPTAADMVGSELDNHDGDSEDEDYEKGFAEEEAAADKAMPNESMDGDGDSGGEEEDGEDKSTRSKGGLEA